MLAAGGWATTVWAAPITFVPAQIEFGSQAQNVRLEAEVKVTNTTAREIEILSVASDCSCTAGEPRQRRLRPGESTVMPVGMDTRTYQGALVRRLTVHTSAGDAELEVKATIRPFGDWAVVPSSVILPTTLRRQEVTTTVTATYEGSGTFAVLGVATDRPWLEARLETDRPSGRTSVTLRKLPTAPVGSHLAQLTLSTDDPAQPRLVLPVVVSVVSAARVTPNPIILPTVKVGAVATREIVVSGWEEASAPLATLAGGRVEARSRRPDGDHVFAVSVTPTTAGMNTLILELAADAASVLVSVPVILKVEPRE
jgi:hypothetical protein